jgi:hypothetical protein
VTARPVIDALPVGVMGREYRVGVFANPGKSGKLRYRAYTIWYSPYWGDFVGEFIVRAPSGAAARAAAKRAAIAEARKRPGGAS